MPGDALRGRTVVLGVCAGIAAYKAVEVCRLLVEQGAHVVPVLTARASEFVGPMTFSALASEPVVTTIFDMADPLAHTRLAARTDLVVVAPATANFLARYSHGMADDALTAVILATAAPVVVCPAMHSQMWNSPATQANIETLLARSVVIVPPGTGRLAGGDSGVGRMAEPAEILEAVQQVVQEATILEPLDLAGEFRGMHFLITAGGTREPIDPVRYIGNRSSGRQGHAIASEALSRGAIVTLVTTSNLGVEPWPLAQISGRAPNYNSASIRGRSQLSDVDEPGGDLRIVRVETAEEMAAAVLKVAPECDVVVMAAAVADFRPESTQANKHRKSQGPPEIVLVPTTDILGELGAMRRQGSAGKISVLVGFAAETEDLLDRAQEKLAAKGADLIVANDVSQPGVGFEYETNAVVILDADGSRSNVAISGKRQVAKKVLDAVAMTLDAKAKTRQRNG